MDANGFFKVSTANIWDLNTHCL